MLEMTGPRPNPRPLPTGALFRLLVEGVREYAIFMLDPDGYVVSWNSGAERIKGYRADEIVGRHFSIFYPEPDQRGGKPMRVLNTARSAGSVEDEGWRVRKDGTLFWANVVLTALHDDGGRLVGFAKITRDLTEQRRAADTRRQLEVAREAVRSRDDFLTLASHELRTPLAGLQLVVDSLLRGLHPGDTLTDRHVERLGRLRRHVRRLAQLVDAILDVSSMATQTLALEREELELSELVQALVESRRKQGQGAIPPIELRLEGPLVGSWDRRRLSAAISGILENAIKFGADAPIVVAVRRDGGEALVEITDRGPGIAPEDHKRVFERFERAVSTNHFGGFGIGLWAARQIVAAHDGTIALRSALGEGATFTVHLPLPAGA